MRKTTDEIVAEIKEHLQHSTKQYYSDFYIGITNDVERRLFVEHNVSKTDDWWIYCTAVSKSAAQDTEEYFLSKGMKGNTGGGTDDSVYVYCYELSVHTKE